MSILKFIQKLLKIKGYRVVNFTFHNWYKELWLMSNPIKTVPAVPNATGVAKLSESLINPESGGMCLFAGKMHFWYTVHGRLCAANMAEFYQRCFFLDAGEKSGLLQKLVIYVEHCSYEYIEASAMHICQCVFRRISLLAV